MTPSSIFLIDGSEQLVELKSRPYDSEILLQRLLATHPSVLAGETDSGNGAARLLFIAREVGVPAEERGYGRWALDHLFLDHNGVPVLVEVKRSTDLRIRREVVGQMLDYAANAVLYWPVEKIRQLYEETCRERGVDPELAVAEFLGCCSGDGETDRFWESVDANLHAGRIRMVFAADVIPKELRRIVEFLGEQMSPAQVAAIEVRQYAGGDTRAVVPTLIQSARRMASGRQSKVWELDSFFAALLERRGESHVKLASEILGWAEAHAPVRWWGNGRKDGSCYLGIRHGGRNIYSFSLWTYGKIEVPFQWRQRDVEPSTLEGLAEMLNRIPGVAITSVALTKRPTFDVQLLANPRILERFFESIDWFHTQIRAARAVRSEPATLL